MSGEIVPEGIFPGERGLSRMLLPYPFCQAPVTNYESRIATLIDFISKLSHSIYCSLKYVKQNLAKKVRV